MAFKIPTEEQISWAVGKLPGSVEILQKQHEAAVADLVAVADIVGGEVKQPQIDAVLAAVKKYRTAVDAQDESGNKTGFSRQLVLLAMNLIAAGLAPGTVCKQLGYGRTAMNEAMATGPTPFRALIEPGAKSVRREVA